LIAVQRTPIPILLYHSVSEHPAVAIRPFTVTPEVFALQLDRLVQVGCTPLTVRDLVDALTSVPRRLPSRPVVLTFDDGFADFAEVALPSLRERQLVSTLFVTPGLLSGRPRPSGAPSPLGRMLSWAQLRELGGGDLEIGSHSVTHPHLDTLSRQDARTEIVSSKAVLEDELQTSIITFAYPNGYSSRAVRRLVREAGFHGACAVKNALSSTEDDVFALARLTIRASTTLEELTSWMTGSGARVAPFRERARTRGWRLARRGRSILTRRPGSDLKYE
jgi:peptidoglycan/xylan/chitin deacetylase (PgdA/CDA1 family)